MIVKLNGKAEVLNESSSASLQWWQMLLAAELTGMPQTLVCLHLEVEAPYLECGM